MSMKDDADDEQRQRLLPYVTRLACADTREIEQERAAYINERSGRWWGGSAFEKGLRVLEGALAIGRQADLLPPHEVTARMEAVRRAKTPTSVPEYPAPPTLKSSAKKEYLPA